MNPSRAESFSDARLIPWVTALEANFEAIQAEVLALRDCKLSSGALDGFQQYRTPVWATPPAPSSSPVEAAAAASEVRNASPVSPTLLFPLRSLISSSFIPLLSLVDSSLRVLAGSRNTAGD